VDAALGLVEPGPTAGPGILSGGDPVGAGHAPDRQEAVGFQRMAGQPPAFELRLDPVELKAADPEGLLWQSRPDACCHVRKTIPLERALKGFDAWITGRKRFQASTRAALSAVELDVDGKVKVNPLASWSRDRIEAEFESRGLPRHPLEADGFLSIGCMPCTDRVAPGQDIRSGRWAGLNKTECGIHMSAASRNSSPI
jgi:phosphoadenosine phosphosulfate reductase